MMWACQSRGDSAQREVVVRGFPRTSTVVIAHATRGAGVTVLSRSVWSFAVCIVGCRSCSLHHCLGGAQVARVSRSWGGLSALGSTVPMAPALAHPERS